MSTPLPDIKSSITTATRLRALGFCGADDSVHPHLLVMMAHAYPVVEFGILFRPDKAGMPRYASDTWVEQLANVVRTYNTQIADTAKGNRIKLAAHLCGSRVNEVLNGQSDFVQQLQSWGFQRVQINATAVNGVETSRLTESILLVATVMKEFPQLEFIVQKNEETRPLWQGLIAAGLPPNVSMLVDESKGTGVLNSSAWPPPPELYDIGYAGGIGPPNIRQVLQDVAEAGQGREIWVDMESSLRSITDGNDVFNLNKCYKVIAVACEEGLMKHPNYLLSE
ncbi:predicted protein [Phaeodactylum tricornutum CCAP 1055/1]|jgi:hypothetical protein|uniref:Uncharacterized protein n=2 Tax=Phaeodactylum tricornutum TaxID=2850 RepID=B7G369_PHATC|nr:predicted protein [Phaeodactylum tricornutum CCAP 1055/1]EEC46949.1 predicted protein [Phaeodactylum tricornutum CCAP 1055/1]|eukprot:XP_002181735.1 predicted protein [Phaeodactylum tricornutum CCAP 1055/1]